MNEQLAVVFPGQGSQVVGMLADIAAQYPEVKQAFVEASDILHYDLWCLIQEGPAEELDRTERTQPALLTASYALWQMIQVRNPLHPVIMAGHSLGEYTALVCSGALHFADGVKLVAARGQFMQEAVSHQSGAMAAIIGLDTEKVATICKEVINNSAEILSPANYNSPAQVVIAGHKSAVLRAMTLTKERGAKLTTLIPVSVPSHCWLMQPAALRLAPLLENIEITNPQIPVINNVDVECYHSAAMIHDGLLRQLYCPVRWVEIMQWMISKGIKQILECGPGKVLTGLNKRIDKNFMLLNTADLASLEFVLKWEHQ